MVRSEFTLTQEGCVSRIHTRGHVNILSLAREGEVVLSSPSSPVNSSANTSTHKIPIMPIAKAAEADDLHAKVVCAAISTVEQQFFYALKELVGVQPQRHIDVDAGEFELQCERQEMARLSVAQMNVWKTLSRSLIIGAKMIEAAHSESFACTLTQSVQAKTPA